MSMRDLARKLFPSLAYPSKEALKAVLGLQEKLNAQRKETDYWRKRCLAVEDLFGAQKHWLHEEAKKHDGLHWRL